ncbi:protein kinase [Pectobacterium phage Jarilo]|uniref:Protein kinase n=1 Tax=Pectobacterium phage Jarilo TaxID=2163634 RepID=A0A2S1GSW1_9CAUD|nr:serine-threonine kinase [Pectobacterium phage Jarilo]AWD92485.1 protein kinase [Pectobacterium phage Jarilo]
MKLNALTRTALINSTIASIKALPIDRVGERPTRIVELLAVLVDDIKSNFQTSEMCIARQTWYNPVRDCIAEAGFELLGQGYFSAAFSHPMTPKIAYKVGFKKEDSGAAYAAYCRMNAGLTGIPKMLDIQRHSECYTVIMPLYQAYTDREENEYRCDQVELVRAVANGEKTYVEEYDPRYREHLKHLEVTMKGIKSFFKGIASIDMHNGNVMFDEYDNLVITDPVSFAARGNDKRRFLQDAESFIVDAESLLKEVAVVAEANMIAKCVARHQSKQPDCWKQRRSRNQRYIRRVQRRKDAKLKRQISNVVEALNA